MTDFIEKHWDLISANLPTFIGFAVLVGTAVFGTTTWRYSGLIDALREQLKTAQAKVDRAEELVAARPSSGSPFEKMTTGEFKVLTSNIVGECRTWLAATERRGRDLHDRYWQELTKVPVAEDEGRRRAFNAHTKATLRELHASIKDFRERYQVKLKMFYDELLRRLPFAEPATGEFDYIVNTLQIGQLIDEVERLAHQLS